MLLEILLTKSSHTSVLPGNDIIVLEVIINSAS